MPLLSRLLIKFGLLWFVASLVVAVVNSAAFPPPIMMATWLHMLVVGWVSHLIFGVAIWMFPKYTRDNPRGSDRIGFVSLTALELGLVLRCVAESFAPAPWTSYPFLISAILQWFAGVGFLFLIWPRVKGPKERKRAAREAK